MGGHGQPGLAHDFARCEACMDKMLSEHLFVDKAGLTGFRAYLRHLKTLKCSYCGGRGHDAKTCSTRTLLDKHASKEGIRFYWGQIKYAAFYKNFLDKDDNLNRAFSD